MIVDPDIWHTFSRMPASTTDNPLDSKVTTWNIVWRVFNVLIYHMTYFLGS